MTQSYLARRPPEDIIDDLCRYLAQPAASPGRVRAYRELPRELANVLHDRLVMDIYELRDGGMSLTEVAESSGIPRSTLNALRTADGGRSLPADATERGYGLSLREASVQLGIKETRWRRRISRAGGADLIEGADVTLRRIEQGWRAWRSFDPVAPDVLREVDHRIQAEKLAEIEARLGDE
ncbi:hypothetical protein [Brevibacterium linens]|uniref:hypothetical protein n=1 Tax=Brevibacterium linens TaxID=1703 RepID=UPI000C75C119|nr:hypothetical protein [Brevibacterium linens]